MTRTVAGMPANEDAERFVIGTLLFGKIDPTSVALEVGEFSLDQHRRIFVRLMDVHARGDAVDRVTVANELMNHAELEAVGGIGYLVSLDEGLPQLPNIDAYALIVKEKATLRRAIYAAQNLINRCMVAQDGAQDILTEAERFIGDLARNSDKRAMQWLTPGEVLSAYPGGINAFLSPHIFAGGIATPWPSLTTSTGGFHAGELVVIGGRPSMGKSIMAMQIAHTAAREGHGVAVVSLEMSKESLLSRLTCSVASVDAQKFRAGYLSQDERRRMSAALSSLHDIPLRIDDSRARSIPAIMAGIRKLAAQHPVRVIIVDHLQLMVSTSKADNRHHEISAICHALKHMAEDFKCTVVLCSQLNRKCEEENRRPQTSDLKESGSIEEDADLVIFCHRWERYQKFRDREDMRGRGELILAKQRSGPIGIVHLAFLGGLQRFEEPEYSTGLAPQEEA